MYVSVQLLFLKVIEVVILYFRGGIKGCLILWFCATTKSWTNQVRLNILSFTCF